MLYAIIVIIILGLIVSGFSFLSDLVGGSHVLVPLIILILVSFFVFSWSGVLIILLLFTLYRLAKNFATNANEAKIKAAETNKLAAEDKKQAAEIHRVTELNKQAAINDESLKNELMNNCQQLGEMDKQKWREKLPNYVDLNYSSSFDEIVNNFARQIEQQKILSNIEWFEVFKEYIAKHPNGVTITKMLNEVSCPVFQYTHTKKNGDLLYTLVERGTEKRGIDIPPLFNKGPKIEEANEHIYTPTSYLLKQYRNTEEASVSNAQEMNFDDL